MERELDNDHVRKVCAIKFVQLLRANSSALERFERFWFSKNVSSFVDFDNKLLHLCGSSKSTKKADDHFVSLQNEILIDNIKNRKIDGVLWWYQAWDATWQLYDPRTISQIEYYYQANLPSAIITNEIDEHIKIDYSKCEEIYDTRVKRICRSKVDECQPIYWTLTPINIERFVLDSDSIEYCNIKSDFDQNMRGFYSSLLVIERIQNLPLFKQFCIRHDEYKSKYGQENNGTMRYLYHGCPEQASQRIIERGFNRSYSGINGCRYGRGVYFSSNARYSNGYATPNDKRQRRMFYNRVLVGRSMIGQSTMREPDDGFDTTTNGSHTFVCYYDSQCYPEYLLTYI